MTHIRRTAIAWGMVLIVCLGGCGLRETTGYIELPTTQPAATTAPAHTTCVTIPEETLPTTQPDAIEPAATSAPKSDTASSKSPKSHSHKYKSKTVAPTCEENGYTIHTCNCGGSYVDSEIPALGHTFQQTVIPPQVGVQGYTQYVCGRCGFAYEDDFVAAIAEPSGAEIAGAMISAINQYRMDQGSGALVSASGANALAKYRSRQLLSNFDHDSDDIQQAYADCQYGRWVEAAGGEGCYEAATKEIISYAAYTGSAEEIGQQFARGFRKSSQWAVLGSGAYSYVGVGVTQSGNTWYVCVIVDTECYN